MTIDEARAILQIKEPYAATGEFQEIARKARNAAARRWHPDRGSTDPDAATKFKTAQTAYEVLAAGPPPEAEGSVFDASTVMDRLQELFVMVQDAAEKAAEHRARRARAQRRAEREAARAAREEAAAAERRRAAREARIAAKLRAFRAEQAVRTPPSWDPDDDGADEDPVESNLQNLRALGRKR